MATEVHSGFASVADEWDDLADRVAAAPFLRPGWFAAWHEAFGAGRPEVMTIRRAGRLAAALPLLVGSPRRLRSPANFHTPEFGVVAEDVESARAMAGAVLARRPTSVDLWYANPEDPFVRALTGGEYSAFVRQMTQSPWIETDGDWEGYWNGLPGKLRREVSRRRRRLEEEQGEVTFEFAGAGDDVDSLMDEGFSIEGSGWKVEQGTAITSRPETLSFYRSIGRWAAERGWLQLAFMRVGGRAAAFDFNIVANGRAYVLKGGYDTGLRRYAPRTLLTLETIERVFSEPDLVSYEFLGAPDPYKLELASLTREFVRVQVFAPHPLGQVQRFAWRHGRPLVKSARERVAQVTARLNSK